MYGQAQAPHVLEGANFSFLGSGRHGSSQRNAAATGAESMLSTLVSCNLYPPMLSTLVSCNLYPPLGRGESTHSPPFFCARAHVASRSIYCFGDSRAVDFLNGFGRKSPDEPKPLDNWGTAADGCVDRFHAGGEESQAGWGQRRRKAIDQTRVNKGHPSPYSSRTHFRIILCMNLN